MPFRIGNFDFDAELLRSIAEVDRKTWETGIEHGITMCTRNWDPPFKLETGRKCKGSHCEIDFPTGTSACRTVGKRLAGATHGHPGLDIRSSPGDMLNQIYEGFSISCVTGNGDLRCDIPKRNMTRQMIDEYPKMLNLYMDEIIPFYDRWEKTGACPARTPEQKRVYQQIEDRLRDFFDVYQINIRKAQEKELMEAVKENLEVFA